MITDKPIMQAIFDTGRCRHIAAGQTVVLHCYHFTSLTIQLANDCSLLDAKKLLAECSEDAFYTVLANYYRDNNIIDLRERILIAEQYFSEAGLGKLKVKFAGLCAGEVELSSSHVDEGWIKKWGYVSYPINYIGCGYVTAVFSAIYNRPKRTYSAREYQSIACGDKSSIITVTDAIDVELGVN